MKKKICIIIALVLILGTVLTLTVGLNVSLDYSEHTMVEVPLEKEFLILDIKAITKEVFQKSSVEIQKASEYEDMILIKVDGITEEQKTLLCQKINQKYSTDITVEDLFIKYVANTRLRDIITPYIIPVVISTIAILIYMCIKFKKQGVLNILLETSSLIIISQWLYLSILVITRYPINRIIIPAGLMIYFAVILTLNYLYEKNGTKEETEKK